MAHGHLPENVGLQVLEPHVKDPEGNSDLPKPESLSFTLCCGGREALKRGSFSSQSLSYPFSLSLPPPFFVTIILLVETSKILKGVLNHPADGILPLFRAMGSDSRFMSG